MASRSLDRTRRRGGMQGVYCFARQGPPGTGKTSISIAIVRQWIAGSAPVLKVLGTSDATTAVNNLASDGVKAGLSTMSYGRPEKVHRDLHESHMLSKLKALRYSQIHRTDFICATRGTCSEGTANMKAIVGKGLQLQRWLSKLCVRHFSNLADAINGTRPQRGEW